jgi:hypothetical protein
MFRIATVVLLAASLSAVTTAQGPKNPIQQAPTNDQPAAGTVSEPDLNGDIVYGEIGDVVPQPIGGASLKMSSNGLMVHAYVHGSQPGFLGVVGLSLTKDLTYSYGLPPLLSDAVVMAFGATDTQDLGLRAPLSSLPAESITLFGQALVIDAKGFWSSNVVALTIAGKDDGSAPANGSQVNADAAAAAAIN